MVAALRDLAGTTEFREGLGAGMLAALAVAVTSIAVPGRRVVGGWALAVAAAAALAWSDLVPGGVAVGLVLVAVGSAVAPERPTRSSAALVPGAVVLALTAGPELAGWARVLLAVTVVVGGPLAADFSNRWDPAALAVLAVTVAGVYVTTPDTEHGRVLVGAALPFVVLGWPMMLAGLGRRAAPVAVALTAWTAVADGRAHGTAVVAGIACLGVLVAEPVGRRVVGAVARPSRGGADVVALVALHLAAVLVVSRLTVRLDSVWLSAAVAVSVMAAAGSLSGVLPPFGLRWRRVAGTPG
jgi:hypothetical protein